MAVPMINHRGPEFKALLPELVSGLRWAFQTENDIIIYAASGTGGMESAVANLVAPGERVLAVITLHDLLRAQVALGQPNESMEDAITVG